MLNNHQNTSERATTPGISHLFKAFLSTLAGGFQTRLELIVNELEEERERLEDFMILAAAFIFCLCMGVVVLSFFIAAFFWDTPERLYVIAGLFLGYFLAAAVIGHYLRKSIKNKPRLFAATLGELAKDRDQIKSSLS